MLKLLNQKPKSRQANAAAFGRLCVETDFDKVFGETDTDAAAFGRLCVETAPFGNLMVSPFAAAFGRLCVETRISSPLNAFLKVQPPSGGCVLKLFLSFGSVMLALQPPSGGCVLKHQQRNRRGNRPKAAAFGRLCVET